MCKKKIPVTKYFLLHCIGHLLRNRKRRLTDARCILPESLVCRTWVLYSEAIFSLPPTWWSSQSCWSLRAEVGSHTSWSWLGEGWSLWEGRRGMTKGTESLTHFCKARWSSRYQSHVCLLMKYSILLPMPGLCNWNYYSDKKFLWK